MKFLIIVATILSVARVTTCDKANSSDDVEEGYFHRYPYRPPKRFEQDEETEHTKLSSRIQDEKGSQSHFQNTKVDHRPIYHGDEYEDENERALRNYRYGKKKPHKIVFRPHKDQYIATTLHDPRKYAKPLKSEKKAKREERLHPKSSSEKGKWSGAEEKKEDNWETDKKDNDYHGYNKKKDIVASNYDYKVGTQHESDQKEKGHYRDWSVHDERKKEDDWRPLKGKKYSDKWIPQKVHYEDKQVYEEKKRDYEWPKNEEKIQVERHYTHHGQQPDRSFLGYENKQHDKNWSKYDDNRHLKKHNDGKHEKKHYWVENDDKHTDRWSEKSVKYNKDSSKEDTSGEHWNDKDDKSYKQEPQHGGHEYWKDEEKEKIDHHKKVHHHWTKDKEIKPDGNDWQESDYNDHDRAPYHPLSHNHNHYVPHHHFMPKHNHGGFSYGWVYRPKHKFYPKYQYEHNLKQRLIADHERALKGYKRKHLDRYRKLLVHKPIHGRYPYYRRHTLPWSGAMHYKPRIYSGYKPGYIERRPYHSPRSHYRRYQQAVPRRVGYKHGHYKEYRKEYSGGEHYGTGDHEEYEHDNEHSEDIDEDLGWRPSTYHGYEGHSTYTPWKKKSHDEHEHSNSKYE